MPIGSTEVTGRKSKTGNIGSVRFINFGSVKKFNPSFTNQKEKSIFFSYSFFTYFYFFLIPLITLIFSLVRGKKKTLIILVLL